MSSPFTRLNNPVNSPDLLLLPELVGLSSSGPAASPLLSRAHARSREQRGRRRPRPNHHRSGSYPGCAHRQRGHPGHGPLASRPLRPLPRRRFVIASCSAAEVSLTFLDDGAHGDGAAGDGIYGAPFPPALPRPGQMVRWYITATDTTGTNISRLPPLPQPDCARLFRDR